jgi:tryptophan synthase alpha chain
MKDISGIGDGDIKKYIMTYANIIYSYGIESFSTRMNGHVQGIIIPDLPNRMAKLFYDNNFGIPIVPFATLETRESDIELMDSSRSEFIYFVGLRGITGAAADFGTGEFTGKVDLLRKKTSKKIVIGFGIKTAEDAEQALALGDGFVVGTEAVKRQGDPETLEEYISTLT